MILLGMVVLLVMILLFLFIDYLEPVGGSSSAASKKGILQSKKGQSKFRNSSAKSGQGKKRGLVKI